MIVEISVISMGVGESQSRYVAEVLKVLKEKNVKFEVNPMGTVLEVKSFKELGEILDTVLNRLKEIGVPRIYVAVKADWRREEKGMEYKVKSVLEKL